MFLNDYAKENALSHHHHHTTPGADNSALRVAFFLNLGFTLMEIVGGSLINSVAILSDALHDLGDSFSLGLAWFLSRFAEKESDSKYSYGYRRFSLLGALINALILIVGSIIILSEAIPRLLAPESFSAPGMIAFGVLGILVNGAATWRLRGSSSANAQVVGWHLLEDVLGWAAVLIVGVISLFANIPILDPLLSIGITLFVLYNVFGTFKGIVEMFLQAAPNSEAIKHITEQLAALPGVQSTHHVHLWSLDGQHHVLSAHLVVEPGTTRDDILRIKKNGREMIQRLELEIEHVTLEVEYESDDCSMLPCDDEPDQMPTASEPASETPTTPA